MTLTKDEENTLKGQGLKEDIRNQLSNAKNIPSVFKAWEDEKDLEKKEKIFKLLKEQIKRLEPNVDHICDSLDYYEAIEKKMVYAGRGKLR